MTTSSHVTRMAFELQAENLTSRLETLHARLMETAPAVDRIACALYDPGEDLLKTFINSTRTGHAISKETLQNPPLGTGRA